VSHSDVLLRVAGNAASEAGVFLMLLVLAHFSNLIGLVRQQPSLHDELAKVRRTCASPHHRAR
jgi:hypothetical protein